MSMRFLLSKEEKERRSAEYIKLLFPHGLEQRDRIKAMLDNEYPKHKEENILFNYIVAKEHYIKNTKGKGDEVAMKYIKRIRPRLEEADRDRILRFIKRDVSFAELEEYPSVEALIEIYQNI